MNFVIFISSIQLTKVFRMNWLLVGWNFELRSRFSFPKYHTKKSTCFEIKLYLNVKTETENPFLVVVKFRFQGKNVASTNLNSYMAMLWRVVDDKVSCTCSLWLNFKPLTHRNIFAILTKHHFAIWFVPTIVSDIITFNPVSDAISTTKTLNSVFISSKIETASS